MSEAKIDRVIERKLDSMKKQLLDTGKRNRMINYRETKRATLRIMTPAYNELFDRLVIKEESLSFQHPIDQDYDLRAYSFLTLMKTLGHEIPVHIGDIETAASSPAEQKTTLRNLRSKARLSQEEQGTNILYLSFGFIKWREKNNTSSPQMVSPLIMVPASLTIKELNAPYMLSRYDDDVVVNPTLAYKFEHEYNMVLPEFEVADEKSLDKYFSKIEKLVDQRGWQLVKDVSLGLVSFLKISMYYDLEKKHDWLMRNSNIRALCGDTDAIQLPEAARSLGNPDTISPLEQYQVIDADSSQQKAIQLSKLGVSFVMQGPPGTGKSQTITNIIAEALADGKKILFVSEKAAALEVVLRRLKEAHISDFCLSLHDYKANKRDVLKQIGDNLRLKRITLKSTATNDLVRLAKRRDELNEYASELHEKIQPLNITLYEAFGELAQYTEPVDFVCEIKSAEKVSETDFHVMTYNVGKYVRSFEEMSCGFIDNPWRGTSVKTTSTMYLAELKARTEGLSERLNRLVDIMSIPVGPELHPHATLGDVKEEIEKLSLVSRIPLHPYDLHSMPVPVRKKLLQAAKTARLAQNVYRELLFECNKVFDESVFEAPAEEWLKKYDNCLLIIQNHNGWAFSSNETILEQLDLIVEKAKAVDLRIQPILRDIKVLRGMAALSTEDDVIPVREVESFLSKLKTITNLTTPFIPYWLDSEEAKEARKIIIGAAEAVKKQKRTGNEIEENWLPEVLEYTSEEIKENCLAILSGIRNRKAGILLQGKVAEELAKNSEEIQQTLKILIQYIDTANDISKAFGFGNVDTWIQLENTEGLANLVYDSVGVLSSWLNQIRREDANRYLQEAKEKTKLYRDKLELLSKEWEEGIVSIDAHDLLSRFKNKYKGLLGHLSSQYKKDIVTIQTYAKRKSINYSDDQIIKVLYQVREVQDVLKWFTDNENALRGAFGKYYCGVDSNWKNILSCLEQAQIIVNTLDRYDGLTLVMLSDVLDNEQVAKRIQDYYRNGFNGENINRLKNEILRINIYFGQKNISIRDMIVPGIEGIIADCNRVYQFVRQIASKHKFGEVDLSLGQIEKLADTLEAQESYKQWFIDQAELIDRYTIGDDYNNKSFWDEQLRHLDEAVQTHDALTDQILTKELIGVLCDNTRFNSLKDTARAILSRQNEEDVAVILHESQAFIHKESTNKTFKDLENGVACVMHAANDLIQLVMECNIYAFFDMAPLAAYKNIATLVKTAKKKAEYKQVLQENKQLISLFGDQEEWSGTIAVLEYVNALATNQEFKSQFSDAFIKFFCDNQSARDQIQQRVLSLNELYLPVEKEVHEFASVFPDEDELIKQPLSEVAARYNRCLGNIEQLDMWLNYNDAREDCLSCGLDDFVRIMEERNGKVKDAEGCFRYSFFQRWCQAVIASKPSVARFKKFAQDERIKEFCQLDVEQFATAQQRIRSKIIDTYPDLNVPAAAGDEMNILQREMNKKAKIMPLRRLFRTIPNLLLRLKPCLMMSPLSVSYFLEADSYHFDMVIFDEASQVFPQDALGSIMRANQVIIAGDSRQLPPTNFFSSSTANNENDYDAEGDEDDFIDEEISDSILEEADKVMTPSTLLWHYRSQNEQLIAFSNQEIYDNRLITFPGCREHMKDTGVEFIYVKDGLYEGKPKNCNVLEAKKCVELIEDHINNHPSRSLGIIAFSEKQQQAILDEVQEFRESHPRYESFFSEDKTDPFFVKNLENVQGDERDTIVFSVGYGYTKEQREKNKPMALRFGPLGRSGGERRLNVAITRAKVNVKLVASILPKDINLDKTDSMGIKLLHDYLNFARMGIEALHTLNDDLDRDDMCSVVKDYIVENGYSVKEKVGCSGYKIDLAVIHPRNPECYLASIECDGASFAGAETARERDRLRKDVLERMGWKVYRVWSTEWVKNPEVEGKKLLNFLKEAEQQPFDYTARTIEKVSDQHFNDLVEEVEEKQDVGTANKYGFVEYIEADLYDTPPARKGYSATLNDHILYAVSIEQPISMELLCQRIAPFLGFSKATTRVVTAVENSINSMRDKLDKKEGFITKKGFINPVVRIPAYGDEQRSINNIASCELMEAMRTVAENSFGLSREGLIIETTKALGYARRGQRIQAVLENTLNELIRKKIIHMVDEKVHTVEASIYG